MNATLQITPSFKRILLVDDDNINNLVFEKISKTTKLTADLTTVISAVDAISYFEILPDNEIPDAIFLDIDMPIMTGWEFVEVIKNNKKLKNCKIFMYSSSPNPDDRMKAAEHNRISEFITKPLSVKNALDLKKKYAY